jgi:hydroxymethylpyrimidine/phosphomethylpyrimidine kinase
MPYPIALTLAGSDSSGGAGIQADLKTFSAHKVYGASVITAVTAQNTLGVSAVHNIPVEIISAQIRAVFDDLAVKAVKIGMLSSADIVRNVAKELAAHQAPNIVLDPVMVAASGAALLEPDAVNHIKHSLMPKALLITPNLPEAAALLGVEEAIDETSMRDQALALMKLGAQAVLIKGGHGTSEDSLDVLLTEKGVFHFSEKRIATRNTHGTGCTLSSSIAANLALGHTLETSVKYAKHYITQAIRASDLLNIGHGSGPVHHFYESGTK